MLRDLAQKFRPVAPPQLIDDMKTRGVQFEVPTDPMNDNGFVGLLARVHDIGGPTNIPADPMDEAA